MLGVEYFEGLSPLEVNDKMQGWLLLNHDLKIESIVYQKSDDCSWWMASIFYWRTK